MKTNPEWTTVIRSSPKWFGIKCKELWKYRDLIFMFVKRDFIGVYKQTILGPLWCIIKPLLTTFVFSIVFGAIMHVPTNGVPSFLFYLTGIVVWTLFSGSIQQTSATLRDNVGIFGNVYFPRLVTPIATILSNLIHFAIQFSMLVVVLCFFYLTAPGTLSIKIQMLLLPLLVLQTSLLALGIGLIISSLTVKYRDLGILVSFGLQLWMYATPVVYPSSQVPGSLQTIIQLNPMSPILETFRFALLGIGHPPDIYLWISIFVTVLVLCLGVLIYERVVKQFMDIV